MCIHAHVCMYLRIWELSTSPWNDVHRKLELGALEGRSPTKPDLFTRKEAPTWTQSKVNAGGIGTAEVSLEGGFLSFMLCPKEPFLLQHKKYPNVLLRAALRCVSYSKH